MPEDRREAVAPSPDPGTPISWRAVEPGTPVVDRAGARIGSVASVVADDDKDIFHGIAVDADGRTVLVEQARVRGLAEGRVDVDLSPDDVRALPSWDAESRQPL